MMPQASVPRHYAEGLIRRLGEQTENMRALLDAIIALEGRRPGEGPNG